MYTPGRSIHDPDQFHTTTIGIRRDLVQLLDQHEGQTRDHVMIYSQKGGILYISRNQDKDITTAMAVPNKVMIDLLDYRGPLFAWRPAGIKGRVSVCYLH